MASCWRELCVRWLSTTVAAATLVMCLGVALAACGGPAPRAALSSETSTSPPASGRTGSTGSTDASGPDGATTTSASPASTAGHAGGTIVVPKPSATTTSPSTSNPPPAPGARRIVIAWQPSHQDDTGAADWHEYVICGDMVDRTIALATKFDNVKAWEIGMGLTGTNNRGGTNRGAFDSELKQANDRGADVFISVHVDGTAPSGVMGMHLLGDKASGVVAAALAKAIADGMGLHWRATRAADLYSLNPVRNKAKIRVLLEIGDNVQDRALLEKPENREKIASLLTKALDSALAGVQF